ncbi:MAG: substrate-binding domain-containing protein [Planctomycetota bacterium]
MNRSNMVPVFLMLLALAGLARPLFAAEVYDAVYGQGTNAIVVATGSPGELGLLEVLAKAFVAKHSVAVRWKKAGSGQSLTLLKQGKVDVVLVHAPEAERRAVAEGWAVDSTLIGCNEFYIVGPADDPARVSEATTAADAYRRVAHSKAKFLSRGDDSGTQQKEASLWRQAGITPSSDWYVITGAFMFPTLRRADKERAYFMTDSSTWIAAPENFRNLRVLFRGDPHLVNVYHALRRADAPIQSESSAAKFVAYLRSADAQAIIREFGKDRYRVPLYRDAAYASALDGPGPVASLRADVPEAREETCSPDSPGYKRGRLCHRRCPGQRAVPKAP